ncbi:MAG: redox-regulated ATPase YchF [candidate division Zixibacteria bacterium]
MMLKFGIIGLPQSGKSTIFNALSGAHAAVGDYSTAKAANIAMVKIPDPRIERLVEVFKPRKITYAEVEYIDIAGLTSDASSDRKKEAAYIHSIRQAEALLQVVRCFDNPDVPHPDGSVDPKRDIAEVDSELMLADMMVIENRLTKVERQLKVTSKDRDKAELDLLKKLQQSLEDEKPLRELELTDDEIKRCGTFGFLTLKPMLYILNLGENQLPDRQRWEDDFAFVTEHRQSGLTSISGSLQMDIADLDEADREDFMKELGIESAASDVIIHKSFDLLGMIVFLTGGEEEVHSWPIRKGTNAHNAAGEIHTDIQRGFIKAELTSFDDLDRLGSWSKARDEGKLHLHGKDYIVQDGDVILFRFNV